MESQKYPHAETGVEQMVTTFIAKHPEYAEKQFSADEIRQVAALIEEHGNDSVEDVVQKALDARLTVRDVAGKAPVINDKDEVIGMARSIEEGKQIYREDKMRGQ